MFSRTCKIKNNFGLFKYSIHLLLVKGKKWKELINLVIEKEAENTVLDQECEPELVAKFLKEEEKKVVKLYLPRFLVKFTALNKKSHFENLRKEEFCFADKGVKVFVKENTVGTNRLGISISSKHANAVNRNRFKRRIKEAVRGLETELNLDILVEGNSKASQLNLIEIKNILTRHPLL